MVNISQDHGQNLHQHDGRRESVAYVNAAFSSADERESETGMGTGMGNGNINGNGNGNRDGNGNGNGNVNVNGHGHSMGLGGMIEQCETSLFRRKSGNSYGLQLDNTKDNNNMIMMMGDGKFNNHHTDHMDTDIGDNNNCDNNKKPMAMIDFDDILPMIGEFGRYQKILFLCMIPFAFFVAFIYFSQIFITLIPEQHWCSVPELDGLPIYERLALSIPRENGEYSNCRMYAVNYTEILANGIKMADPTWPTSKCQQGWNYNFSEIPYTTVATEQNWVCEDAALPTYAQSIFFLGAIVGGLLFGWIADRFGRIPALIGTNLMGLVAGCGTAFVNNFWQFALMRFFVGFAFDNSFTMMYILVLEYVGPKYRTFVANMSIAIFFTMAACALPWIAYFIADWKIFVIVTSLPLLLVVLTPLIVPESARWLVSQGKVEKAVLILKKLEKRNGTHVPANVYQTFTDSCLKIYQDEAQNNNFSVLDLFKTPRLRRTTVLLIIIWMAVSLVFDGHVRNVGSLGLDIFFTFTVASFTELPADTLLTLLLDRWGRRWLACGTMVASGVFSLLATIVPVGIYSATLAIAGRFFVNISYNIGLQYAAEILPTVVRAQGVAFIHIMGYVASIIAPFVVYLANVSPMLPLIILGILGIVGGLLSLFLPETLNHDLPQTLADGESFGRNQSIWDLPCLAKHRSATSSSSSSSSSASSTISSSETAGGAANSYYDLEKKQKQQQQHQNQQQPQHSHFQRSTQTGASLNASTRGELRSSILRRSVRSRYSTKL